MFNTAYDLENIADYSPQIKSRILFAVLLALTIGNMMILNVEVILPNFIENNEWLIDGQDASDRKLTSTDTSLIISIFSIA